MSLVKNIKKPRSRIFRRAWLKRRLTTTGLFETNWQEITDDVLRWGTVHQEVDLNRPSIFKFNSIQMQFANDDGRYNPETVDASLWNGYLPRQRSLIKLEAGFIDSTVSAAGVWSHTEYPTTPTAFVGLIQGDILLNSKNVVTFNVMPLTQVFRDFPARNLLDFTTTGVTASRFIEILRDMTSGGNYIFRSFFESAGSFVITSTTNNYSQFNTSTAKNVYDKTTWDVITRMAEAENFIPYMRRDGSFKFGPKSANDTVAAYHFFGNGYFDTEYGLTIKKIDEFGEKVSSYYSRIEAKYIDEDTATSLMIKENDFTISATNITWQFGHRTFSFENTWIANTATADSIAQAILDETGRPKTNISFTTTFIPHVEILDRVLVSYDSETKTADSRWDTHNWATASSVELYWDKSAGDAIVLNARPFKVLSVQMNLDALECKYVCREI